MPLAIQKEIDVQEADLTEQFQRRYIVCGYTLWHMRVCAKHNRDPARVHLDQDRATGVHLRRSPVAD